MPARRVALHLSSEVELTTIDRRWPLPTGWEWTVIATIAEVVGGGTPPARISDMFSASGIPWITPADLTGYNSAFISRGRRDLSEYGYASSSASMVPAGTVLFSSRAPIGYCAIAANPLSTSQGFKNLVLVSGVEPEYVRYYLLSSKKYAESKASGTTFLELSGKRVGELAIPLAPSPEQRRIVEKLDKLLGCASRAGLALDSVAGLAKNYKARMLEDACSGKLTKVWRESRSLPPPSEVRLGDVADDFAYGTSAKSAPHGRVPVLRMGNIQSGELDWKSLVYTSDEKEIAKYRLTPGDVLFNRTNSPELVGKTAVFKGERDAIFAGYLIRITCGPKLLPEYLAYCLNSPSGRDYSWRVKSDGVSQSNINASKLADFTFYLPSLEEQKKIIGTLEKSMSWLDDILTNQQAAAYLLSQLKDSIFSKAFAGRLLLQDPGDEPAGRFLQQHAQGTTPRAARGRNKSSPTSRTPPERHPPMATLTEVLIAEGSWMPASLAARRLEIGDGSTSDSIEKFYADLRSLVGDGRVEVERRGDEDWLRYTPTR